MFFSIKFDDFECLTASLSLQWKTCLSYKLITAVFELIFYITCLYTFANPFRWLRVLLSPNTRVLYFETFLPHFMMTDSSKTAAAVERQHSRSTTNKTTVALVIGLTLSLLAPMVLGNWNTVDLMSHRFYRLHWRLQGQQRLHLRVEVKSRGYFALGVSKTGTMNSADIVTGYIHPNGSAILHVRKKLYACFILKDTNQIFHSFHSTLILMTGSSLGRSKNAWNRRFTRLAIDLRKSKRNTSCVWIFSAFSDSRSIEWHSHSNGQKSDHLRIGQSRPQGSKSCQIPRAEIARGLWTGIALNIDFLLEFNRLISFSSTID